MLVLSRKVGQRIMVNLSQLREELEYRDVNGVKPDALYWYLYLGDETSVPLCRACILDLDPNAVFEGDEGADPSETWCYQRVTDCQDGGARICHNEFHGVCRSRPPVIP